MRPARTTDDLPLPDGPTTPSSGEPTSRATSSATSRSRPKNTWASSHSKLARPLNGHSTGSCSPPPGAYRLARSCTRWRSMTLLSRATAAVSRSLRPIAARSAASASRRLASPRAHSLTTSCTRAGMPPVVAEHRSTDSSVGRPAEVQRGDLGHRFPVERQELPEACARHPAQKPGERWRVGLRTVRAQHEQGPVAGRADERGELVDHGRVSRVEVVEHEQRRLGRVDESRHGLAGRRRRTGEAHVAHGRALRVDLAGQLGGDAGLPHPADAGEEDERRAARPRQPPGVTQPGELLLAIGQLGERVELGRQLCSRAATHRCRGGRGELGAGPVALVRPFREPAREDGVERRSELGSGCAQPRRFLVDVGPQNGEVAVPRRTASRRSGTRTEGTSSE